MKCSFSVIITPFLTYSCGRIAINRYHHFLYCVRNVREKDAAVISL
jgi:hypothetical protein